MLSSAGTLLLCLLLVLGVHAQYDDRNFFVNPPVYDVRQLDKDQVWKIGETQLIKWRTFYTEYTIRMWQEDLVGTNITDDVGVGTPVYSALPICPSPTKHLNPPTDHDSQARKTPPANTANSNGSSAPTTTT